VNEAIPLLHAGVQAVVLDVRLPRRSGLDLLEFIRGDNRLRELPVLILTGVVLTREEEAIIARHRAYVFYKPKSYEQLAGYLDRLTSRA
jgi:CheY-like chemotaxis protein